MSREFWLRVRIALASVLAVILITLVPDSRSIAQDAASDGASSVMTGTDATTETGAVPGPTEVASPVPFLAGNYRHRIDVLVDGERGAGLLHDPRPSAVLRRNGTSQERTQYVHVRHGVRAHCYDSMGGVGYNLAFAVPLCDQFRRRRRTIKAMANRRLAVSVGIQAAVHQVVFGQVDPVSPNNYAKIVTTGDT